MTKHLGPIIAFIVIAGIALYIVRHFADFLVGFSIMRQFVDDLFSLRINL